MTAESSKHRVLQRVRQATATMVEPAVPRLYRQAGPTDTGVDAVEARRELLVDRLVDYKAEVVQVEADGVSDAVTRILVDEGAHRAVLAAGFPVEWLPTGIEVVVDGFAPPDVADDDPLTPGPEVLSTMELDSIDAVVTTASVAVAETGTIVLDGGAGQGRRAITLLPDLHIIVIRTEQVVDRVPDALVRLDPARPQTWISGPSATSDIELDRVEGVHGPRRLRVVLIR